ncbi:hypothetical protein CAOG_007633 [Capsaspora owczarzaki ATCC 30864]|uniref:Lysosomal enzyme trafficking factor n=2 Tax=Capsaspora owczarzaki (strain ATCC 30864) TaxID=595528 RepID=A0A0D2WW70_CAPO3|nr:hypothetical protein CAOG_007633 [Capsaspora owczarzaki ATCC 30864]
MNFRQRFAFVFLILSFIVWLYLLSYIFDWHAVYTDLSKSQLDEYQQAIDRQAQLSWSLSTRAWLSSIPFWGWCLIIGIPFLQLMIFLWVLTRPNPMMPFARG